MTDEILEIADLKEFDLERKKPRENTNNEQALRALNKVGYGVSSSGMARLLRVNIKTILKWERYGLIYPGRVGNSRFRKFALKDLLRGVTIKYLMSELGFRKYSGVKLLLEITNQNLKNWNLSKKTIDNIKVDRYLMRVLNYSLESIPKMRLHSNSRKDYSNDYCDDEDC